MRKTKVSKDVELKNKYTGDIVYTRKLNEVTNVNDINFIRVYSKDNPERTYLVNRDAYEVIK